MDDSAISTVNDFLKNRGYSKNAIRNLVNPTRRVLKFSKDEICEAIMLRGMSPQAYEILRLNSMTIKPLPTKMTLSNKLKSFQMCTRVTS